MRPTTTNVKMAWAVTLLSSLISAAYVEADDTDSLGRVVAVSDQSVQIALDVTTTKPSAGDTVEFLREIPGTGIQATVAKGEVTEVRGERVTVAVSQSGDRISVGMQARIHVSHTVLRPVLPVAPEVPPQPSGPRPLPGPPWIGIVQRPAYTSEARNAGVSEPHGVYVEAVHPDGPADRAGLRGGDVVTSVNGTELNQSFGEVISELKSGQTVEVIFYRAGRGWQTGLVVGDKPANIGLMLYELAEDGHAWAQHCVARRYLQGDGVKRDTGKALKWFAKAAEQGVRASQAELGRMYQRGTGVDPDIELAADWYRKAADANWPPAQVALAAMYAEGLEGEPDLARARQLYQQAADEGSNVAVYALGCWARDGVAGPQDYSRAYQLFLRAAEQGHADSQNEVGWLLHLGKGTSVDMTQAAAWYRKAAEQGHVLGQCNLGQLYLEGNGVQQDFVEAGRWLHASAVQNLPQAQCGLGRLYAYGPNPDYAKAVEYFELAVKQGFPEGKRQLAGLYLEGKGVPPDDKRALELTLEAARAGNGDAFYGMGWLIENGRGCRKDDTVAAQWYKKGVEAGSRDAMNSLAILYSQGRGVPLDMNEAVRLYRQSAELGLAAAQNNLALYYAEDERDYATAMQWFQKAAEINYSEAIYNIGVLHENGWGVRADKLEAASWYLRAAELGHDGARSAMQRLENAQ